MPVAPAEVRAIIEEEAQAAGVDPQLALAVAFQESGFNNEAIGDSGNSGGPFQENSRGRGAGRPMAQRFDVRGSARRFIAELQTTARKFPGVDPGTLAARTQRPADAAGYARSINAMLQGRDPNFSRAVSGAVGGATKSLGAGSIGGAITGGVPGGRLLTDAAALMKLGLPDPMSLWQRGGRSAGGATGQGVSGRRWPVDQPPSTNAGFGVPQTITGGYGNVFGAKPHNAQNQPLNTGMDVTAAAGATIYPVTPGEIVEVKQFNPAEKAAGRDSTGGYGNSVVILGDDGLRYRYSHMRDQSQFQVGQRTPEGQPLGFVGATGNATGPHLDLEITDAQGNYLDGGALIRGDAQVTRLPPRGQPDPGPWQNQPIRGAQRVSNPAGGAGGQGGAVAFPVQGYQGQVSAHWGSNDPGARGGADLMAPEGTPVVSMVPGTVEWASTEPVGGNNIGIRGDDGRIYYYAHLRDAPRLRQGQRVEGNQPIGAVGRTGNAAGGPSHLHIGIGETEITKGSGPLAGLGANFDATSYLQTALAGQGQWQGAGTQGQQPGFQLMSNPRSGAPGASSRPPADGPDPTAVWLQKMGGQVAQGQQGLGGVPGMSLLASTMGAGPTAGGASAGGASATPPADGPDPAAVWQQLSTPASHNAGTPAPSTAKPVQERQLMADQPGTAFPGGGKYPWDPGYTPPPSYVYPWERGASPNTPTPTPTPTPGTASAPDPGGFQYPWDGKLPWMQPPATSAPTAAPPASPSAGDTGTAGAVYDYAQFAPADGDSPNLRAAKLAAERAQREYDTELAKIKAGEASIAAAEKAKLKIPGIIGPAARATTPPEILAAYDAIKRRDELNNPESADFKRMDALKKAVDAALGKMAAAQTTNPADAAAAGGRPAPGSAEERARGAPGQGAGPTGQGGPVHSIDVGRYIYLYDDKGQWLGAWPKQEGNKPEIIGSTTGPKVLRYNPATDTADWVDNPAYTNKRSPVTTGDDVQYLVYEDEQGHKTVEQNPNYNPWSAGNTTEGKGIAEGRVSHITRDGQVITRDTLLPEERALLTRGEEARIGGVEATTAKTTAEAAALKRKEDNWKKIEAAWQAGASMEEINGLVLQSAQDVDDFVKLQAEDRARQAQAETQRSNLATEELTRQQRRKEDVAQYGTAMESYGRFGVASAPWQTSVLAAAAPLQGVGAAAKGMNIDPNAPWAQGVQKQYDDYTNRQANTAGAARQAFETSGRSMFGDRGNQVNSGAGGNYGTTQKPPPQATGAWTPPGQAGPGASGTYVNQAPADPAAASGGTGGTGGTGAGASYGGENPAAPAGAGRTPVQGKEALDLNDPAAAAAAGVDVQPGKAATVYANGEVEIWDIPSGGGWLPQPTGVYGNGTGTGGGGDESGKPVYSQGRRLARKRSPVPGKQAVDMGDGKHVVTHYDDGSKEVWALDGSGPSWEGVGGGGSGYWFDRPTTYGVGHTGGGGASVWQLPPGATVSMAQGLPPGQTPTAQQVQPQQQPLAPQSGVAPYQPQPVTGLGDTTTTARFPTTMAGGYGGPAATPGQGGGGFRYRDRIGKAHQRGKGKGKGGGAAPGMPDPTAMGVGMSAPPPGAEPFLPPGAQGAPPAGPPEPLTYGAGGAYMGGGGAGTGSPSGNGMVRPYQPTNTPAPMWDAALGAGGRNMTMGPGGRQGSATLYSRPGGGVLGGGGSGPGGGARGGTNYGGPTAPAAITPLQRLMAQSGLVPRMAGQAAGSPGGI
jgi:murein DD-endopeptidase MepM/ murein hydrolase activator NlpD